MAGDLKLIRGRALRATRLDGCGASVLGPKSQVVTEGFISVGLTANNEAGEAISITNAAGKPCIVDTPAPKFVNYGAEINFCGVHPDTVTMLTGQLPVLNADGEAVGFRINSKVDVDLVGFALELWTGVATAECSAESASASYGYVLLPFLKGGALGDLTVENGAVNFTITGATTRDGSGWGVGPYDVVFDENSVESPLLEPITEGDHLHLELTPVAPPTFTDDGAVALGVEATGATAGTPGTTTPSNSYAPENFAALTADPLTASPNTAWTTGQSIVLRDGSRAHWNGTAWVAGPA